MVTFASMKARIIILILLLANTVCFGQSNLKEPFLNKSSHDISNSDSSLFKKSIEQNFTWNNNNYQFEINFQTNFHYTEDGILISQGLIQFINQTQSSIVDSFTFDYLPNGKTSRINEYIQLNNTLKLFGQQNFHFNTLQLVDTFTYKEFRNSIGNLELNHRHVYEYNSQNLESFINHQDWDTISLQWVPTEFYQSHYDLDNNLVEYFSQQWIDSIHSWKNLSVDSNYYNGQHQIIKHCSFHWIDSLSYWKPILSVANFYNANSALDSAVTYSSFNSNDTLEKSTVDIFQYDRLGNLINQLIYSYSNGAISSVDQFNFGYSVNGLIQYKIKQNWDGTSWINVLKDHFSFDSNANQIEDTLFVWNTSLGLWQYMIRTKTSWLDFRIGQNIAETEFMAFPNPTNENEIHLHLPPLESENILISIYNSAGQLILSENELTTEIVHIELPYALANGLYVVNMKSGNLFYSTSFILNK